MTKARAIGVSHNTPKRRLTDSPFQWNDRPAWDYAGKARVIWGYEVDARTFSIRTNVPAGVFWTIERQAWAVSQGFFVHRELVRERPVIIGINRYDETFSYFRPYRAMQEIERRTFRREPGYGILLSFIEQQDRYGYTGVWDKRVMCYSDDLTWYKLWVRAHPRVAARHAILRRNMEAARDQLYLNRVRHLIVNGHKQSSSLRGPLHGAS